MKGGIDICPHGLFCLKFDVEKLLFEAFFGILRIFGSVQHKNECIFLFLYNLIFQLNTCDNHMLSPVAIKNGLCPHSSCSRALVLVEKDTKRLSKEFKDIGERYKNIIEGIQGCRRKIQKGYQRNSRM